MMSEVNTTLTPFEILRRSVEEKYPPAKVNHSYLKTREDDMRGRYTRTPEMCLNISKGKKGRSIKSTPKSEEHKRKLSEALKGRLAEHPMSAEDKLRRSIKLKGKVPWNKGLHLTEEDKLHKSLAQKGKPHSSEHTKAAMLAQNIKPNKAESMLSELLEAICPGEYEYTGDGKLTISGVSPDFTNCNGQKKVIELFGEYWHSFEKTGRERVQEEQVRREKFSFLGFDCLIIWESELEEIDSVAEKIRRYNCGEGKCSHRGSTNGLDLAPSRSNSR